ncbi:MAG: hypothetical protein NXH87_09015 [Rhodobiaceae bacterium]|nr:hypothetical protein [Rhodobiaceae bacterium]
MTHKEFKRRLLIALHKTQRPKSFNSYIDPREAATAFNLSYEPGELRACIKDFDNHGYLTVTYTIGGGEDGGLNCSLTSSGIEEAEELEANFPELATVKNDEIAEIASDIAASDKALPPGTIQTTTVEVAGEVGKTIYQDISEGFTNNDRDKQAPASDRTVAIDHNSEEYKSLDKNLAELVSLVKSDRTNDFENRDQILKEIEAGRTLLSSPTTRVAAISSVLGGALMYLAEKFVDTAIGDVSQAAWSALKILVGM